MGIRSLILRLVSPETRRKMEEESRKWVLQCPACKREVSIWDAGGIRYKAAGRPRRLVRCRACGKRGWHTLSKRA